MLHHQHPPPPSPPTLILAQPPTYDHVFKLILIGDACAGKSTILRRFVEGDRFIPSQKQKQTIGVEFGTRVLHIHDKTVKLRIWDTAGQERYRSVAQSYYRLSHAAVLVYDVTCRTSFEQLAHWAADARALAGPNIVLLVCGNKIDLLESQRRISLLEGSRFAQAHDAMFLETSAMTGANVEEAFLTITRAILSKVEVVGENSMLLHGSAATTRSSDVRISRRLITDSEKDATANCSNCYYG